MFACHFLTPIDQRTTVDHWLVVKNYRAPSATDNEALKAQLKIAFDEDKDILEAIQREEDRVPGGRPLRLALDKGAVMMRSIVQRMAEAERTAQAAE
jgi:vanillate O-demethylase monooxygenase subunit